MIRPKTIGQIFISIFLVVLAVSLWMYWRIANDPGPTDGIPYGVGMILIIVIVIYYFILTAWTWRLLQKNDNDNFEIKLEYAFKFCFGDAWPDCRAAFHLLLEKDRMQVNANRFLHFSPRVLFFPCQLLALCKVAFSVSFPVLTTLAVIGMVISGFVYHVIY